MDWLGDTASVIGALAASGAAIAAVWLVRKTQRQVDIGQRELFASNRPILCPVGSLTPIGESSGRRYVDMDNGDSVIGLKNIGSGVALNVIVVLFGPHPDNPESMLPRRRSAWLEPPLAVTEERGVELKTGGCMLLGTEQMNGEPDLTLLAPQMPSRQDVMLGSAYIYLARLAITYHDVYGRKHASVWDFDVLRRWHCRGYREDIDKDLDDFEQALGDARKAQMAPPTTVN